MEQSIGDAEDDSNSDDSHDSVLDDDDHLFGLVGVRRLRRHTNWMYRSDALRPIHVQDINRLFRYTGYLLIHAMSIVAYAASLYSLARVYWHEGLVTLSEMTRDTGHRVLLIASWVFMQATFIFLDAQDLIYYPIGNRNPTGERFPSLQHNTIASLSENDAEEFTNFGRRQLEQLFVRWRVPSVFRNGRRHRAEVYTGEECMIYYLYYMKTGHTYLHMGRVFGGDPRRFSYTVRLFNDHLHSLFYHKITGDSLRFWLSSHDNITRFRSTIWNRLINTPMIGRGDFSPKKIFLDF